MTCSEVVDKKRSILSYCCHNYNYILNSNGMAIIALTNNMRDICYEIHVHLRSILHGVIACTE